MKLFTFFPILIAAIFVKNIPVSKSNDKPLQKISVGTLTEENYTLVLKALANLDNKISNDTIIIKYDYEKESCWNRLDKQDDNYIKTLIASSNKRILENETKRKNISVYQISEGKSKTNKIIKWNDQVKIDTDKTIHNLLFTKKAMCGNSILITPSRKFIILKSDSHFELLDYSKKEITKIFNTLM